MLKVGICVDEDNFKIGIAGLAVKSAGLKHFSISKYLTMN